MKLNEKARALLIKHCQQYPKLEIRDIFKFIYQSAFGCEHMISSYEAAKGLVKEEAGQLTAPEHTIEALCGEYSRVYLGIVNQNLFKQSLSAETFAKLFFLSARDEPQGKENLEKMLQVAGQLVAERELPFDNREFEREVREWRANGYPSLHHSHSFRQQYKPSYRVISNRFLPFLQLFSRIDSLLDEAPLTLAIEGGSGSGKSTLAKMLEEVYDCNTLHMDDFFLRPCQRTAERYAEIGGNIDRERFLEEVLLPHSRGKAVLYRRFDCTSQTLSSPIRLEPKRLTVIEGVYSMHESLASYYGLSVFLDISKELQRSRIQKRNSPELQELFFTRWIPLEERYFCEWQIKQKCDICIQVE